MKPNGRAARLILLPAVLAALSPRSALAWGERGHHAVARAAALQVLMGLDLSLLGDEEAALHRGLRDHFRFKALQLGHLANIPDTAWRSMGREVAAMNSPTHFLDAERWTRDIGAIPLDYAAARAQAASLSVDLWEAGTLIWRAEQFYQAMLRDLKTAKALRPGSPEFKRAAQRAILYGGLMAHFVADAAMPLHTSQDHDGYGTGNGGLHAYFEMEAPNAETPEIELAVFRLAPRYYERFALDREFLEGGLRPAARLTREICRRSHERIAEMRRLDDTLISERSPSPVPGKRRTPARRKPPEEGAAAFRDMIVEQLALATAAVARLWRGAWEEAGRPDLSRARSWHYEHRPSFVEPDYDLHALMRLRAGRRPARLEEREPSD